MIKKIAGLTVCSIELLLGGTYPSPIPWLSWFAFIPLFMIVLHLECGCVVTLLTSLFAAFFYFGFGLAWLLRYELRIFLLSLLVFVPIFPAYFLVFRWLVWTYPGNWTTGKLVSWVLWVKENCFMNSLGVRSSNELCGRNSL